MRVPERLGRPWVALHVDLLDDERILGMGDAPFAYYCRLLAYTGAKGCDGVLPYNPKSLARRLRVRVKRLLENVSELERRGLVGISDAQLVIVDWHRQGRKSPAERAREWREIQRLEASSRTSRMHGECTPCVPDVDGDLDKDGDADGERDEERSDALPKAWAPRPEHLHLAQELGVDLDRQAAAFRDYNAAKGGRSKNWDASFSRWLRKTEEFGPARGRAASPVQSRSQRIVNAGAEALRRLASAEKRLEAKAS